MGVGRRHRSRAGATWIAAAFALLLLAMAIPASAVAAADAATVTAAYSPSELELLPGETRTAVLLVSNPTAVAVTVTPTVAQQADEPGPVTVALDAASRPIPAGGSITLPATVTLAQRSAFPVTVVTTVGFVGKGVSGSAIATLKVTSGAVPTASPGALTVTPSGDSAMVDTQGADVVFAVQNNSTIPQQITKATLTFPSFLQIELADGSTSEASTGTMDITLSEATLSAGNGTAIHLRVTAPKGVQPGTAIIGLALNYHDTLSGTEGFSTGAQPLTLTVFGEAAVTGAFGTALAPALFVVPGLLFVLVLWFLWWKVYPRKFPIDMTPPGAVTSAVALAILGVLCALPFPYLYRVVFGRDYIVIYSFADIGLMCALGIATGAVVWLLGLAIRGIVRRYRFMPGDPAPKVFRKLTRWRRNLAEAENAAYTKPAADPADAQTGTVFILRVDGTTALVCPALVAPSLTADGYATDFTNKLTNRKNRRLYRLVKRNGTGAMPQYASTSVDTVTSIALTELTEFGRDRIVDLEGGG